MNSPNTTVPPVPAPMNPAPNMLDEALRLAALGQRVVPNYPVIPLLGTCTCKDGSECKSAGKHPSINGWQTKASTDPKTIRGWWKKTPDANIGIVSDGTTVRLDVDPDRGGVRKLAELEAQYGVLPRLWEVRSGGAGTHLYFIVPPGLKVKSSDKWKDDGVEVKALNSNLVAPPSLHFSGKRYAWLRREGNTPPLLLPDWLSTLQMEKRATSSSRSSSSRSSSPTESDQPPLSEWYKRPATSPAEQTNTDNSDNPDTNRLVSVLSGLSVSSSARSKILAAIEITFPRKKGIRNWRLIELGRWLLRIDELQDKDAEWFRPVIRLWLDRAEQLVGPRDFEETWSEWFYIWGLWLEKSILDEHPVFKASEIMKKRPTPPIPAQGYRSDNARRLVALCAALAEVAADGDGVFYISCRDAARVLGLDPEKHCKFIASVFRRMVQDRIIEKVGTHVRGSMKAQRYRYHEYNPVVEQASMATAA
jgi:hypothetical protein